MATSEGEEMRWTAIVFTCQNRQSANCFQKELNYYQKLGSIHPDTFLLAVDDPRPNIGSGSAVLNALLCVSEHLAARSGCTVVNADAIQHARILIVLLGSTFPFGSCGHGFMPYSEVAMSDNHFKQNSCVTNFEHLLLFLNKICTHSPPGVWISSSDMILQCDLSELNAVDVSCVADSGIAILTVLASPEYAGRHGACRITEQGDFAQIIYQGGPELLKNCVRSDGNVVMISGIAYCSPSTAAILLSFHNFPPLDSCTYVGIDNGAQPLSLSLFFDILLCLTTEINHDDYVAGHFISRAVRDHSTDPTISFIMQRARAKLWMHLKDIKMKAILLPGVQHHYLRHIALDALDRYQPDPEGPAVIINSSLSRGCHVGNHSLVIGSEIQRPLQVGANCFLSGINGYFCEDLPLGLAIPDGLALQEFQVSIGDSQVPSHLTVITVYGVYDNLVTSYTDPNSTFCNIPWKKWFTQTGVQPSDLWFPNMAPKKQTLMSARLFMAASTNQTSAVANILWLAGITGDPDLLHQWRSSWRLSLDEILLCVDCEAEFSRSRILSYENRLRDMEIALLNNKPVCFLPFFKQSVVHGLEERVMQTLDDVACRTDNPLRLCRVYACIADVLGMMAAGGIRGGPAANISFKKAFALLENQEFRLATKALSAERSRWISEGSVDRLIRASRHYERAAQMLTRQTVATAREFIKGSECPVPAINEEIVMSAPARIDLAGAWTDTPPQAYEFGGLVSTVAIKISGKQPVKATVKRITELKLVLLIGEGAHQEIVECTELSHLADYSQPHAPGALLKTAFICSKIIEFPSSTSLVQQLKEKFGSGFQLHSVANLPQGSGLGTSSILGGVVMGALWRAVGQHHSPDSLIHAVLHLEQMLTTGGGWQDQCGGLYGGLKMSWSEKKLPVHVQTRPLEHPDDFIDRLNRHLLLLYTGKTRLARNVLQDVLRNWHSRDAKIMKTMNDLIQNAKDSEDAIKRGDLATLGQCLKNAQQQKLVMAPGSLPHVVDTLIKIIDPLLHGCCLCGAGGGGFLAAITVEPDQYNEVQKVISSNSEFNDFVLYKAEVDTIGITFS
ncbi:L-fucose kinase-like [Dysidea avara]|uniref:L-fucose kinase-like n=1 Tax=Dysidea avara TaxID=196820 RepID=UPI0033332A8B